MKTLKKPKAKFRVGQPIEFNSSDDRKWCPGIVRFVSNCDADGWTYVIGPEDLWCLESEIREPKKLTKPKKSSLGIDIKTVKVKSKVSVETKVIRKFVKHFKPVPGMFSTYTVMDQDTEATILVGKDGRTFSLPHGTKVSHTIGGR